MTDGRCRILTTLVVMAALAAAEPDRHAAAAITVENVASGETLRYPVALLRGRAPGEAQLRVVNRDHHRPDGACQAAVVRDRFVTLVELVPGRNRLKLSTDRESADLSLTYRPMTTPYQVNVVYVTAGDGDPRYITQRDDDRQNFADKLDTAAKLMQTFTAEALAEQGFGRKTFKLDLDPAGRVRVHLLKHPLARAELQAEGFDLYGTLAGWLDGQFPMQFNKNMVLMAFTEKNAAGELKAHTALGGGGMGLFGSGSLFSWPNSLEDAAAVFADTTPIDASRVHDDSVDRSVIWGLASTTIGATLHEMGHTFDLPHSPDPFCIMSRGFDHFNRRFSAIEPPSKHAPEPYAFRDDEVARYWPFFAAQLAHHRWFQPDAADYDTERGPTIRLDWAKK
ncbi:MAG: metallopeptidase, partial [Thermoguttaceae bacterium]|nr:metallopeptidase [Thermoguttaceae bacterium]